MATKTLGVRGQTRRAGLMISVLALALVAGCGKSSSSAGEAPPPPAKAEKPVEKAAEKAPEKPMPPPPKAPSGPDPSMERFSDKGADNQIDVPKDWSHNPVGDSLLIQSPDKQIFIEMSASLAMGKDKADEKKLLGKLEKSLQNVKRVGPMSKAAQNGLTGWRFSGTGTKAGKKYDWESFALEDPAGKGAFGLVYASTADLASHRAIIDKILGSISQVTN